jgi:serine/threonine-protein kinase
VASQIALGLEYAHSFGFIHRDLKPDNIFLCKGPKGDTVRILDFGSVKLQMETGPKLTAFGTTLGSPYYMSPEQAMGKQDVDQRTDVFALAAILYECVTGKIAFEAGNVAQILMRIINQNPTPPSQLVPGLPPAVDDVVDKGLRKDKTKRYGDASSLANAFGQAYGLAGDAKKWAEADVAELGTQITSSRPPPAKAFSALSDPPPATATSHSGGPMSGRVSVIPGLSSNGSMKVGIAVAAVAVVALIAVLLLR